MENSIFNELLSIFASTNYRFRSHFDLTLLLQQKGYFQNIEQHKAVSIVWDHLNRPSATYPFCSIDKGGEILWGLEKWLPPKKKIPYTRRGHKENLKIGEEIQHTISAAGNEITNGIFPLRGSHAARFLTAMDYKQSEYSVVELSCYGSEKLICLVTQRSKNWVIEGKALHHWYLENGLTPGDKIWLCVENINPLALKLYTEWDRDVDTYRRYEQRRQINNLSTTILPIRDIIWLYFKRTQKISHIRDVIQVVLAERPEISQKSIGSCLGVNNHLFSKVGGKDYWGLKEWGLESIQRSVPVYDSNDGLVNTLDNSVEKVSIDYILANIVAEDLVYKILRNSSEGLSVSQITEKVASYFGINRDFLARTTFFNSSDRRFVRLLDGKFALRDNLEEVITDLKNREDVLLKDLEHAEKKIQNLADELISVKERYEMLRARDLILKNAIVSEFLSEIISRLGYSELQDIFHNIRQKFNLHE